MTAALIVLIALGAWEAIVRLGHAGLEDMMVVPVHDEPGHAHEERPGTKAA